MLAWLILITGLGIFLALAVLLFRPLRTAVIHKHLGALGASSVYWLTLAAVLFPLWWLLGLLGNYVYSTNPSLREPAWDIGLVMSFSLGFCLSAGIGFIAACCVSWRLVLHAKRASPAPSN